MASIYSDNGKLYLNIQINGRRIRKSTGLNDTPKNRRKVENDLPELVMSLKMGKISLDKPKSKTVSYYADVFLENKLHSVKPSTIDRYHHMIKIINKDFGTQPIKEIKVSDARKWVTGLLKTRSVKTVRNYIITFSGICKEAFFDEELEKNPFEYVKLPKKDKPQIHPFSVEEMNMLLNGSSGWFQNLIAVLGYTGMRVGEALGLKWGDIDWNRKEIYIQRSRTVFGENIPKTRESIRFIPIFEPLVPYIKAQFQETGLNSKGYLFLTQYGEPYNTSQKIIEFQWAPLLRSQGLFHRRMYELRHTFATNMLNSGKFSAMQIAKWLGHTNTQMLFTTYARYIQSEQNEIDRGFDLFKNCQNMVSMKKEVATK